MIECVSGDFFDYEADIRVNTVNCVGVMGAGVALEFKNRFPEMFHAYVGACKRGEIAPGKPFVWEEETLFSHCTVVNLPTKVDWRDPSQYEYIEADLRWLRDYLSTCRESTVVTLPALGCGHGGLDWRIVKERINFHLGDLAARILLFEPSSSNKRLSPSREDLLKGRDDILVIAPGHPDHPAAEKPLGDATLYCIGNTQLLRRRLLSVVCGNTVTEREASAIEQIVRETSGAGPAILLPLNNRQHRALASRLLSAGAETVLVVTGGILGVKDLTLIQEYPGRLVIVSFTAPDQGFARYSYVNSLKFRTRLADATLYAVEDPGDIERDVKLLPDHGRLFYVNFWAGGSGTLAGIGAHKLGIDPETGKPNVTALLQCLSL